MIRLAAIAALAGLVAASPLLATPPDKSLRPQVRPASPVSDQAASPATSVRPVARPSAVKPKQGGAAASAPQESPRSPRPRARPEKVLELALFGRRKKSKGSVCGVPDIKGEEVGDVPAKLKGCGVQDAVSVRSVSGVRLSKPATMNCATAMALNSWVESGVKPAFRRRGPVVEMHVAAGYSCRTRNNKPGAKISEHGRGKAIDISAFAMSDGEVIEIGKSWGEGSAGRILRRVWSTACGPFGTVLGPESDRYHRNHIHVDTASYRGGNYCR